jgi:hypothetical protein
MLTCDDIEAYLDESIKFGFTEKEVGGGEEDGMEKLKEQKKKEKEKKKEREKEVSQKVKDSVGAEVDDVRTILENGKGGAGGGRGRAARRRRPSPRSSSQRTGRRGPRSPTKCGR